MTASKIISRVYFNFDNLPEEGSVSQEKAGEIGKILAHAEDPAQSLITSLKGRGVIIETVIENGKEKKGVMGKIYSILKVALIIMAVALGIFALSTGAAVPILAAFIMLFGSFANSLN